MTGLFLGLFARRLWSLFFSCVCILSLTTRITFASLYPTKPISTTIFAAGRPAQVKWVEDGHQPILGDLGHMRIHLLAGNSTYLSTIAQNVNPLLLSITVYIPQILPPNYHVYTLRFVPSHTPHRPIYTAPFTILPNPFSSLLAPSHPPNPATTSVAASVPSPSSETVHDLEVTTVSQAAFPTPSGKYIPLQSDATTAAHRIIWNLDMEKIKFNLVFLVWPALIGLSLSM